MKLKELLEKQSEYGISDEDMYEQLLSSDKPLAKRFVEHLEAYGKVLEAVEKIEAKFLPGYKPHYKPETSLQIRDRADRTRNIVQGIKLSGGELSDNGKEYL